MTTQQKGMTVQELRAALEALPDDSQVIVYTAPGLGAHITDVQSTKHIEYFSGLVSLTNNDEDTSSVMLVAGWK